MLDTSIVTSGVRNPSGASAALVEAGLRREFALLLSVPLLFEYESVLTRPEHLAYSGFTSGQMDEVLFAILRVGLEIQLDPYDGPSSPDPSDNHILNLARSGSADAIVTFNTRHFASPVRELGVNLYTAVEALRMLRER